MLDNPIAAYLQAAQQKNQNRRDSYQDLAGIGQGLGGGIEQISQGIKQQKQKQQWQQTINGLIQSPNTPPQVKQMLPMLAQRPELAGQLLPGLMKTPKPTSPWTVVPGMLSKNNKPFQENKETGLMREGQFEAVPTGRGNSAFGTGGITLENASPEDLQMARALIERRISPNALGYRDRSAAVKLAELMSHKENTPYVSYGADVNKKVAEDFSSGKEGRNVLSLNTALGHADSALKAYEGVKNMDIKLLNKPLNILRKETNNPNIVKLQTSINALSGELATVFKGSAGTDQEIGHWLNVLSQDLTPGQAVGAIQQVNDLLNSRLEGLNYMRETGMGQPSKSPLLSPKGSQLNKRFNSMNKGSSQPQSTGGWSYVGPAQ